MYKCCQNYSEFCWTTICCKGCKKVLQCCVLYKWAVWWTLHSFSWEQKRKKRDKDERIWSNRLNGLWECGAHTRERESARQEQIVDWYSYGHIVSIICALSRDLHPFSSLLLFSFYGLYLISCCVFVHPLFLYPFTLQPSPRLSPYLITVFIFFFSLSLLIFHQMALLPPLITPLSSPIGSGPNWKDGSKLPIALRSRQDQKGRSVNSYSFSLSHTQAQIHKYTHAKWILSHVSIFTYNLWKHNYVFKL